MVLVIYSLWNDYFGTAVVSLDLCVAIADLLHSRREDRKNREKNGRTFLKGPIGRLARDRPDLFRKSN
jgi:hypothetical protein